jgi:hypothetical protein
MRVFLVSLNGSIEGVEHPVSQQFAFVVLAFVEDEHEDDC